MLSYFIEFFHKEAKRTSIHLFVRSLVRSLVRSFTRSLFVRHSYNIVDRFRKVSICRER